MVFAIFPTHLLEIFPFTVAFFAIVIPCYVFCANYITFQGWGQIIPYLSTPSNHSKFSNSSPVVRKFRTTQYLSKT